MIVSQVASLSVLMFMYITGELPFFLHTLSLRNYVVRCNSGDETVTHIINVVYTTLLVISLPLYIITAIAFGYPKAQIRPFERVNRTHGFNTRSKLSLPLTCTNKATQLCTRLLQGSMHTAAPNQIIRVCCRTK